MNYTLEELAEMLKNNPDLKAEPGIILCPGIMASPAEVVGNITKSTPALKVSESNLQKRVIKMLQDDGWLVCEFRKARIKKGGVDVYRTPFGADGTGFPDLVAVKPPRVLFIEDKSDSGSASPEQVKWLLALGKCTGVEVQVLTPGRLSEFAERYHKEIKEV